MRKVALTIAGSDSSGGAGIQADIKTMLANGVYAESVITALTAQNTMGVDSVFEINSSFVEKQLDSVFNDIFPDSIKIGMVSNVEIIKSISNKLKEYKAKNIVVDPVMVSTSGYKLISDDAINSLIKYLFPLATVITPNIYEAEILANEKINNKDDMEKIAKKIFNKYGCNVLLKGGHSINDANDLLVTNNKCIWFNGSRINNENTHGTGCTLSSAIASYLAKNENLENSIKKAKEYISKALNTNLNLGKGKGPLDHGFMIK